MKKKVYHLKKGTKIVIVCLLLFCIALHYGLKIYQDYQYKQSTEYALLTLGYTKEESDLFHEKLSESEIEKILSYAYNEFIPKFLKEKYFLFKNLDRYLDQVTTKDEDFFKYHGTEGYDYTNLVALVNTRASEAAYENATKTNIEENFSMLVNKYNELPSDYEPDDLVDVSIKYYYGSKKQVRKDVYDAFIEMWDAAYQEGIYLIIDSAYRTYTSQKEVYKYYEDYKGVKYADSIAARPGFSEHQTGLSLDIYSKDCTTAKDFKNSKAYAWLISNCYKYGFILRYPDKLSAITGYSYESWHYRYLGKDLAQKVYESGLTYDEYYAFYLTK